MASGEAVAALNCSGVLEGATLILDGPLSCFLSLAGLVGNGYCIAVLFRTSINTTMLVSLTSLAIWDMVLLLASLLHHSMWITLNTAGLTNESWYQWSVALNGMLECARITSTWMLIVVCAERYMAVMRPFRRATFVKRRQSTARFIGSLMRLPVGLTGVACLITLPVSFEFRVAPCVLNNERPFEQLEPSDLLHSPLYRLLYHAMFMEMVKTIAPFLIIMRLTFHTMRAMHESVDKRAQILLQQGSDHIFAADQDKKKSLQMISMLLLGKFLILRIWPTVGVVSEAIFNWSTLGEIGDVMRKAADVLLLLNSATNSFIFIVLKSAFESRRLRRIRKRQRELVAKHAENVLSIGRMLVGDRQFLLRDLSPQVHEEEEQNN